MTSVNPTERMSDLAAQAEDRGFVTHTPFLTPAEKAEAEIWLRKNKAPHFFSGGIPDAERQICFFLPEYLKDAAGEDLDGFLSDTLTAVERAPGHRLQAASARLESSATRSGGIRSGRKRIPRSGLVQLDTEFSITHYVYGATQ